MTPKPRYSTANLALRLLAETRGYRLHILAVLVLGLLSTPLTLLAPVPMKIVVDSVIGSQPLPSTLEGIFPDPGPSDFALLLAAVVLFLSTRLLAQLRNLGTNYLQAYTGQHLVRNFRAKIFRHVQRLSLAYHDQSGSVDSTYRIQSDAGCLQQVFLGAAIPLLTSAAPLLGVVVVMYLLDPQLTLVALVAFPCLLLLIRYFGYRLRKRWKGVKKLDSAEMSVVQEVLSTLRVVKSFGMEDQEEDRFLEESGLRIQGHLRAVRLQSTYQFLVGSVIALATALILFFGTLHVQSGRLTLGELLMVMAYIGQIFGPMRTMTQTASTLSNALASAERVFEVFDQAPEIDRTRSQLALARATGAVAFEKVSFSYSDTQVLKAVSFEVSPGSRIGISGRTGAGKTTLMSLLLRVIGGHKVRDSGCVVALLVSSSSRRDRCRSWM